MKIWWLPALLLFVAACGFESSTESTSQPDSQPAPTTVPSPTEQPFMSCEQYDQLFQLEDMIQVLSDTGVEVIVKNLRTEDKIAGLSLSMINNRSAGELLIAVASDPPPGFGLDVDVNDLGIRSAWPGDEGQVVLGVCELPYLSPILVIFPEDYEIPTEPIAREGLHLPSSFL